MSTLDQTSFAPQTPRLEAIFVAASAGEPMNSLTQALAIPGMGIEGDRYATGRGYYSKADPCEITLIEGEVLDQIEARFGIAVQEGQHRRNLVTRGLQLATLAGKRFRIGPVLLQYDRPRPPCGYMERLTVKGMTRALGEGAGIAARVMEQGRLCVGDEIEVLPGQYARVRRLP